MRLYAGKVSSSRTSIVKGALPTNSPQANSATRWRASCDAVHPRQTRNGSPNAETNEMRSQFTTPGRDSKSGEAQRGTSSACVTQA